MTTPVSAVFAQVRQLESMIRLSESMARIHCQDEVAPKHVKEAFRLLNKSIVRVESPDVQFDEETAAGGAEVDMETGACVGEVCVQLTWQVRDQCVCVCWEDEVKD